MSGYRVQNPATGEVVETFDTATDSQIDAALAAADDAYREWRERSVQQRAEVVKRVAELFAERKDELADHITIEMGKSRAEALDEVDFAASIIDYYAVHGPSLITDYEIPSTVPGRAYIEHRPIGALLGVMPSNFPYYQVARFAAPNLLLGNTILLKHAEICPRSSLAIEAIMREAGVPEGGYQNVFASHDQIATMIADPRVQGVSLTGSERAGAIIGAQAGRHLKKCVLELGGIDPMIVLDAADVADVARQAWEFRVYNGGQVCNSNKRLIVMDDIHDEFVAELKRLAEGGLERLAHLAHDDRGEIVTPITVQLSDAAQGLGALGRGGARPDAVSVVGGGDGLFDPGIAQRVVLGEGLTGGGIDDGVVAHGAPFRFVVRT